MTQRFGHIFARAFAVWFGRTMGVCFGVFAWVLILRLFNR